MPGTCQGAEYPVRYRRQRWPQVDSLPFLTQLRKQVFSEGGKLARKRKCQALAKEQSTRYDTAVNVGRRLTLYRFSHVCNDNSGAPSAISAQTQRIPGEGV